MAVKALAVLLHEFGDEWVFGQNVNKLFDFDCHQAAWSDSFGSANAEPLRPQCRFAQALPCPQLINLVGLLHRRVRVLKIPEGAAGKDECSVSLVSRLKEGIVRFKEDRLHS